MTLLEANADERSTLLRASEECPGLRLHLAQRRGRCSRGGVLQGAITDDRSALLRAQPQTPPPPPPRKGEPLWTIQKAGRRLACELRDDGTAGVEVQMSRDGEFLYGPRDGSQDLSRLFERPLST
jgi:hypothetical protein